MLEYQIQMEIVSYIKNNLPFLEVIFIKNETKGGVKEKSLAVKMGLKIGCPDLLLTAPKRNIMFLEVKKKGEKPRKSQREAQEDFRRQGFYVAWADNFGDSKKIILEWCKTFIDDISLQSDEEVLV